MPETKKKTNILYRVTRELLKFLLTIMVIVMLFATWAVTSQLAMVFAKLIGCRRMRGIRVLPTISMIFISLLSEFMVLAFFRAEPGLSILQCMFPHSFCGWFWAIVGAYAMGVTFLPIKPRQSPPMPETVTDEMRAKKLRILLVGDSFPPKVDGIGMIMMNVCRILKEQGHELLVLTGREPAPEVLRGEVPDTTCGVPVAKCMGVRLPNQNAYTFSLPALSLYKTFREFRPDVVYLVEISPMNLICILICHWNGIPCITSLHTRLDLYLQFFVRLRKLCGYFGGYGISRFLSFSCHNLVVSSEYHKFLSRFRCPHMSVWHSGVDTERFNPKWRTEEMRRRLTREEPEKPLVSYIGRVSVEKNLHIVRNLAELMPHVRFAIVGDGDERAILEQEMSDKVVFTGNLHGDDLAAAYASSDVFLLASFTEAFPMCVIEGLASGLPCCVPTQGGAIEQVTDDEDGYWFSNPHDPKMIADCLQRALDNHERLSAGALAKSKTFEWGASVQQLLDECYRAAATMLED